MTFASLMFHRGRLRTLRSVSVMFVLASYLFAGVLHGFCDCDDNQSVGSGTTVISALEKALGHSDTGAAAENHCHGCFSVSAADPVVTAMPVDAVRHHVALFHEVARSGLPPGIDLPPPKALT